MMLLAVLACSTNVRAERVSRLLNANDADLLKLEQIQSSEQFQLQNSDPVNEVGLKMLQLLRTYLINKRLEQTSSYGGY